MEISMNLMQVAKTAHYIHLAHCHSLGLDTQPRWRDVKLEHKITMMNSISGILGGDIKSVEESHDNFVRCKKADGWKFSNVYSIENKTNPRLTTFDKLPPNERMKESLFFACVYSFK